MCWTHRILLMLALLPQPLMTGFARAEGPLSPESYIRLEMNILQISIDAARQRLDQLQRQPDIQDQELVAQAHRRIQSMYKAAGTSAGRMLLWENRHRNDIAAWLAMHPQVQQNYRELQDTLWELGQQIEHGRYGRTSRRK